ncbi:MAG: AmmeMemoRadiSam system radical SAM enzyme [Candidatus Cloacimonetes bacterium]|nr:AmmeMemoRadiSam system radical SAM enzyme [Candidatus Cloacimonadota bacterium]
MNKRVIILTVFLLLASAFLSAQSKWYEKEAQFYEEMGQDYVQCHLCPHNCLLKEGQKGICGARKNINGKLYTIVYSRPVAINIDPIEKKPLYHFYPGSRILSISTAGCNLRCNFCQNWEISQSNPSEVNTEKKTPKQIIDLAKQYECKSIAFTYTEPTIFYEYMYDIANLAQENNIKTVMVTCGYINEEPFRKLCQYLDAANIDLKGFSEDFYDTYTTGQLQPVLNILKTAKEENINIEITNLVIPQANDSTNIIREMCNWIADSLGTQYPLHFSRFFPKYKLLNRAPTPFETLDKAREIAQEAGIEYVYIGNISSQYEDTFCPACGKKLIDRSGYHINFNKIEKGRCPFCEQKIYGRW